MSLASRSVPTGPAECSARGTSQVYRRSITPCHREARASLLTRRPSARRVRSVAVISAVPDGGKRAQLAATPGDFMPMYAHQDGATPAGQFLREILLTSGTAKVGKRWLSGRLTLAC
jgi:hypothetical protein